MTESPTEFDIILPRSEAEAVTVLLDDREIPFSTRSIKAIDGGGELTKIVIAGGSRAAVKLVDGLASLTVDLFKKVRGAGSASQPDTAASSLLDPSAGTRCDFVVRKGDMKLTLENVPLDDVRHLVGILDRSQDKSAN